MNRLTYTIFLSTALLYWSMSFYWVVQAQPDIEAQVRIEAHQDGVLLEWQAATETSSSSTSVPPDLPLVDIGGFRMPASLVAVRTQPSIVTKQVVITPVVHHLDEIAWEGPVSRVVVPIPKTPEGVERPDLTPHPEERLPSSPVVVLREGILRGEHIAVVALTPIFARDGELRLATQLQALIPQAELITNGLDRSLHSLVQHLTDPSPFLADSVDPPDPHASRTAMKICVTQGGMQSIVGSDLAAVGMRLTAIDPAQLHLWWQGTEVALEVRGADDGRLDLQDEIRFYAPEPGDRWNATALYWLTVEPDPGLRMPVRSSETADLPVRTTADEPGNWRNNMRYDSQLPGIDNDHWFAAEAGAEAMSIPITPTLPLATGTTVITLTGSAYTEDEHQLAIQLGAAEQRVAWRGIGNWTQSVTFTVSETMSGSSHLLIRVPPGAIPAGVLLDSVSWQQPVTLNLSGRGALFRSADGKEAYQLTQVDTDRALYNLSTPSIPVRILLPEGDDVVFGSEPVATPYLLAGAGTLHSPTITGHTPVDLAMPLDADVVYIAPATFHTALEPLIAHRRASGYKVVVVDVQAIYDAWSGGQIDPDAIRSFLRYAVSTWNIAPIAVTLVGDGSSDPRNYLHLPDQNVIPPYLAMVDPWLGETACDTCYAQLDGADPLDDLLPDLALGRLPVKSPVELEALVNKLLRYEASGGVWRSQAVYIADNFYEVSGAADPAGDFPGLSDAMAALLPPTMSIERLYYDPAPSHAGIPWREPDALRARQRTLALLSQGAGLVTYTGHGYLWQWAVTNPQTEPSYLLGLYDADDLTNGEQLPIVLSMTCLSSAFQHPAFSGTTVDERLVLHRNGGAAAVWGSTGLGLAYGHELLQQGFYRATLKGVSTTLGLATLAGYDEIFTRGECCHDAVRTFVLLGDPLTPVRLAASWDMYLPSIAVSAGKL